MIGRMKCAAALTAALCLGFAQDALARKVYAPQVEPGELEIETQLDVVRASGAATTLKQQIEIAGAPHERLHLGAYAVYARRGAERWRRASWKFEAIVDLGACAMASACGLYLEWLRPRGSAPEIEAKALLSWEVGRWEHRLNLIVGLPLGGGLATQGYAWRSARRWQILELGFEAYGAMGRLGRWPSGARQSHLLGPVVGLGLGEIEAEFGWLTEVSPGAPRRSDWKLNLSWAF